MFLVLSFSSTTTAFLAHTTCAVRAAKSARRARTRPVSLPRAALVLARLFDPRRWRHRRRRRRRSRSASFGVWNTWSSRSPSEVATATATPRSMPTVLPGRSCASGVLWPSSHSSDIYQWAPSREMVAERTVPRGARDQRKRAHPSLGSLMRPHLRLRR